MRKLTIVNPSDRYQHSDQRFILQFGAYGWTQVLAYADHLEGALEIAMGWIVSHAPSLLMDDRVAEAYKEAIAEGKSEEEAREYAEEDCTYVDGHYLASWEWWGGEATREQIKAYDQIEVCK